MLNFLSIKKVSKVLQENKYLPVGLTLIISNLLFLEQDVDAGQVFAVVV